MQAIKDAVQFRGQPDPVRGDQPNQKVRDAAKEALDAVYSDTPPDASSAHGGGGGGGGSFGGAPFATSVSSSSTAGGSYGGAPPGGGGGPPGARRMEGIGNPMFKDPRLEPQPKGIGQMTVNDLAREARETVIGIIKDPLAKNADVRPGVVGGHSMPRPGGSYAGPGGAGGLGGAYNSPPPGRSDIIHQTNGEWTMASNRGPGAVGVGGGSSHAVPANYGNDSAYYKSRDNTNSYSWAQQQQQGGGPGGVGGSWASASATAGGPYGHQATPSISVNHTGVGASVVPGTGGGGTAVSDGSYEKQLVMELCPPGGMKPEPPPDKLASFSRLVGSLNADLVCPVLLDCLEDGQPWIIRAKALCVMDVCIQKGMKPDGSRNSYADFFHACSAEIAPLANHPRAAIRDPAKRVLNALGVATPVGGVAPPLRAAAAAPAAAPPAPVADLLDFDGGPSTAPAPPPEAAPPVEPTPPSSSAAGVSGGGSLFGGLNVAGAATSSPPAAPPAAPPTSAPPPPSESLLDLTDAPAAAAPAPTATPTPAAAPSASSFSFMNGSAAPGGTAEVKEAAGMFDNMSIKSGEANAAKDTAGTTPGSAFGFMNSAGSDDTTEKKVDSPANAAAAAAGGLNSFDPLKHNVVSPNSQQKMMQLSPEQMQAMMYQQMMMQQQQMQMAQMMAMQQAAQKRGSAGGQQQMFMSMPGRVMQNPAASKSTFAFMDQPKKEDNHAFDFVQDAVKKEQK